MHDLIAAGLSITGAPADAIPLVIFNADPSKPLEYGLLCALLFGFLAFYFRSISAKRGILLALFSTIISGVGAAFLLGIYFFDNRPIQEIAVSPKGVWCQSWKFWVNWPEIGGMDHSYHIGGGRVGGEPAGWYVEFKLRDQFISDHPWTRGVKLLKTAQCRIDGLDHDTDEIIGTVERYYENSR